MKIKLIKFRDDVILPKRQYWNDAGADIYLPEKLRLDPHSTKIVSLDFGLEMPDGLMAVIYDRSSLAVEGLSCCMAPIDAGYTGPVHLVLTNNSQMLIYLDKGTRVGQLVILPIIVCDFVEELGPERKNKNFGSTGKY